MLSVELNHSRDLTLLSKGELTMSSILAIAATSQQMAGDFLCLPRFHNRFRANFLDASSPTGAKVESEALPIFVRLLQSMPFEVR